MDSFWTKDATEFHKSDEQYKRRLAGCDIVLDTRMLDCETHVAVIRGYVVSLERCSCMDFSIRRVPCKHMYRLAHALGVFSLGTVKR